MILYHFTRPEYLPSIMEHGLKAALAKGPEEYVAAHRGSES
jgi:hypothetical protein